MFCKWNIVWLIICYHTTMKQKTLLVALVVAFALGIKAAVHSEPVGLATFDSYAAKASASTLTVDDFDSFVWFRTPGLSLPQFNSNPARGMVIIVR